MSSTSMGIDILNKFVVVGGRETADTKNPAAARRDYCEHPQPEVDGVGVPVSVMNEIKRK